MQYNDGTLAQCATSTHSQHMHNVSVLEWADVVLTLLFEILHNVLSPDDGFQVNYFTRSHLRTQIWLILGLLLQQHRTMLDQRVNATTCWHPA
jgi:hypothetical protein